jgi:toxin ParE1/3/4
MADRKDIFDYIEADNPHAALTLDQRIESATRRLIDFPESGRLGRIEGTRELTVAGTPYFLPYKIVGDKVRILRVIHTARMWPDQFTEMD